MPTYEKRLWFFAVLIMLIADGCILWQLLLWADRHGYMSLFGR